MHRLKELARIEVDSWCLECWGVLVAETWDGRGIQGFRTAGKSVRYQCERTLECKYRGGGKEVGADGGGVRGWMGGVRWIRGGVVGKEGPGGGGGRGFQDIEGGTPVGRGVIWCIRWDALIRGRRSL